MKYYNNTDNFRKRTHTVRVTFQFEDYKGHIAYKMGGNCMGLDILNTFDPDCIDQDDIEGLVENDCNFAYNEDMNLFSLTLNNDKGETVEFEEDEASDISAKVVTIEIIDCKEDK
ncbi:DUF5406 family protein [Clostridium sp. Mt-5]|uniref:DUF5406 family protein n=1 Tax=Clostridium moutaii TaxID=3240932 RepID=A0ABV4BS33_9CLOT